jgi:hypothetical protein
VHPANPQLDEATSHHPGPHQAAGRHGSGMYPEPGEQPDQAHNEQRSSRPPADMLGPNARDRPKFVPNNRPRYAARKGPGYAARRPGVPPRYPPWIDPRMAQQYRPSYGNPAANRWSQAGHAIGYSRWTATACFQEVQRSDCRSTGSGAVGSPVQLLGYR